MNSVQFNPAVTAQNTAGRAQQARFGLALTPDAVNTLPGASETVLLGSLLAIGVSIGSALMTLAYQGINKLLNNAKQSS